MTSILFETGPSAPSPTDGGTAPEIPALQVVGGQGFGDITHEEIEAETGNSPQVTFDYDKPPTAKRVFLTPWSTHLFAMARVIGYCIREENDNTGVRLRRWLPEFHPKLSYLVAKRVGPPQGISWSSKESVNTYLGTRYINKYSNAILPVEYETPTYRIFGDEWIREPDTTGFAGMHLGKALINADTGGTAADPDVVPTTAPGNWYYSEFDRYVTYDAKPSTKSFAPEPGGFYWGNEAHADVRGKSFVGSVQMFLGFVDITWTWHGVPLRAIPFDKLAKSVGRVNANWVRPIPGLFNADGTPFACKPHQLYLSSYDIKKRVDCLGQWVADVVYQVRYNPVKWTRFYYHLGGMSIKNNAGKAYNINDASESQSKWWYITQDSTAAAFTPGNVNNGIAAFDEMNFLLLFRPK